MRAIVLTAAACMALGCHSTTVIRVQDQPNGGIAFFPLVPVNQEITQYRQNWVKVDVTINESVPVATGTWKDIVIAASFFVNGKDPAELASRVADVRSTFSGKTDADGVQAALQAALAKPGVTQVEPPLWSTPIEVTKDHTQVGSARTVQQIPATKVRYINIEAPYGGSASADIKLDSRGVLGEASAQRQDQLPAAITGAIGTIAGAALSASGAVLAAKAAPTPAPSTTMMDLDFGPRKKDVPRDATVVLGISIAATPVGRTYTLTSIWPITDANASPTAFGDFSTNPCLKLAKFDDHTNSCIVGLTIQSDPLPAAPTPAQPAATQK